MNEIGKFSSKIKKIKKREKERKLEISLNISCLIKFRAITILMNYENLKSCQLPDSNSRFRKELSILAYLCSTFKMKSISF